MCLHFFSCLWTYSVRLHFVPLNAKLYVWFWGWTVLAISSGRNYFVLYLIPFSLLLECDLADTQKSASKHHTGIRKLIVQMAFVPRKYRPTVTDRETCQLSNLHDFWFLSAGNYHPMMWSLLPVCHPPVPSLFPSSLLSILSISHSTLIQEVWLH